MTVEVDRERCAGTGGCVFAAPGVFDQNPEDGRVVVLDPEPGPALRDEVREAAEVCPVQAIRLSA
ncbi:ferredoxin [Actinoplanes sp. NPDC051343]|uniref:ferredoxin n=1 Tax=Actinoplanes sp. NPDC051343 TaxID=3363906 RepID=UPI00378FB1F9